MDNDGRVPFVESRPAFRMTQPFVGITGDVRSATGFSKDSCLFSSQTPAIAHIAMSF
jgi:hypothetical protein